MIWSNSSAGMPAARSPVGEVTLGASAVSTLIDAASYMDEVRRFGFTFRNFLVAWSRSDSWPVRILPITPSAMEPYEHFHIAGGALKRWAIAQLQDSLAVAELWFTGLWILHVPWAPLWVLIAAVFQMVPHLGPILSLIGPALA